MKTRHPLRRTTTALATAALSGMLAVTAFAAPAREGTVSATAPVFTWDGGPNNGSGQGVSAVRCTPAVYECEDTLIKVENNGDLLAEIKAGEGANDLDVAIYKSNEAGEVSDERGADSPDAEDISTGADAKTTLKRVTPGYYVIRVRTFDGIQAVHKGTATLKVPPPPAPPATPPATTPAPKPAAPAKPSAKERRNACIKKAKKKFKGKKNKKKLARAVKKCKKIR